MFLIEVNGERQFVFSLDGYEGVTVVAEDIEPPSDPDAELVEGQWVVPLERLKARKRAEVAGMLRAQFLAGFAPQSGPLQGHILQVRDVDDRTNWLTSQAAYRTAIDAGAGAMAGAEFRTEANETITLTYQEGFDALMAMADWGKSQFGKSWTLKDRIDAMTSSADVEALDVAAEWAALP
jgi:hypothetical protein